MYILYIYIYIYIYIYVYIYVFCKRQPNIFQHSYENLKFEKAAPLPKIAVQS